MSSRNTFAATRRSHRLLKELRAGESLEIGDVTEQFDVQYPQARADLKLLEELYDLSTHRDGRIKVWTWGEESESEYVNVATAASLELGAIALDIFEGTPYGEAIDELAADRRQRVDEEERERLDRLSEGLHLRRTWLPVEPEQMVDHVEDVLEGIRLGHWLHGRYRRADGEVGEYVVLPRCLVWYQARLWLLALHGRSLKLFDVAGFEQLERLRNPDPESLDAEALGDDEVSEDEELPIDLPSDGLEAFLEELDDDPDAYFDDAFGIYAQNYPVEEVELDVFGEWENYLGRYRVHPSQENEPLDEGLRVRFEVGLCPEFKSFLLGMIPDLKIRRPAELREELQEQVREWLDAG